jgi:hypothetical protein
VPDEDAVKRDRPAETKPARRKPEEPATTPLFCTRCGQTGSALWQQEPVSFTHTPPLGVSAGFYLRQNLQFSSSPQIVCSQCSTVHRGRLGSSLEQ